MAISNSWGSGSFATVAAADQADPALLAGARVANAANIIVLAASGNDGFVNSMSSPAALSSVMSVGALFDETDQVPGYSNSADFLDILAPADPVYTTDMVGGAGYTPSDYFPFFNGTSSACPFTAGAVPAVQPAAHPPPTGPPRPTRSRVGHHTRPACTLAPRRSALAPPTRTPARPRPLR